MENQNLNKAEIPALNKGDVSGSALLEYLQNQKRIATELRAPQGEIELLDHIIKKVNEMMDKYYKAIVEC